MSDLKLFSIARNKAVQIQGREAPIEKSLQTLMDNNLDKLLGVRFISGEYSTGKIHGGRIDSLGIDENNYPCHHRIQAVHK